MNKPLTVLILAAGYGRRMGPYSRMINKGLVPYKNRALISHIIDSFPEDTQFVIACGHLGQQVQDYVGQVHRNRSIKFVNIENYAEENTGPATTILQCKDHLPESFLWLACDTLFEFDYSRLLDHNWIAVHPVDQAISQDYCWVQRNANEIIALKNKESAPTAVDAFIGLMYVHGPDYMNNIEKVHAREAYEGFGSNLNLQAYTVPTWLDFGTYEKWQELVQQDPVTSLVKPNEIFYHDQGQIIKYFSDVNMVQLRVRRAWANPGVMPKDVRGQGNFLFHSYVEGTPVYSQLTPAVFERMLAWCERELWQPAPAGTDLTSAADHFYREKTQDRVRQFNIKYPDWSECLTVNGQAVQTIDCYLNKIDWQELSANTVPRFIHGDLHFDNTIYNSMTDQFTCIDWRGDFAGEIYGDIYYDLAKLLGGIRLNYQQVRSDSWHYYENAGSALIEIPQVPECKQYETLLKEWVEAHNLSWHRVELLVPIIYINMSPLHEEPFDKFLVALAQWHFSRLLD